LHCASKIASFGGFRGSCPPSSLAATVELGDRPPQQHRQTGQIRRRNQRVKGCRQHHAAEPAPRHRRAEPDPVAAQLAPQQQAQGPHGKHRPQDHRRAGALVATGSSPSCASTPSASSSTRARSAAGTSRPSPRTGRPRRTPAA
jgi:hypothetical protein